MHQTKTIQEIVFKWRPGAEPRAPQPAPIKCSACQDVQLVSVVEDGEQRLIPCPDCAPLDSLGIHGLTLAEERTTWEDCKTLSLVTNGKRTNTRLAAKGLVEKFQVDGAFIYLHGPYGLGKTFLLKLATADALRRKLQAHYINAADILDDIKAAFDSLDPLDSARRRLARWQNIQFLAIDELDKGAGSDWAQVQLFRLLNTRYEMSNAGRGLTLIASNEPPENISAALASRARDGRSLTIALSGADVRPEMHR